tara:strand:+ start:390 stop:572 length:183 start_codon:yes stop_codon:yes gene_type:complete
MNHSEDLSLKLQKVQLAIAEVEEDSFDTQKQKKLKLQALHKIENAILMKCRDLKIDLLAA